MNRKIWALLLAFLATCAPAAAATYYSTGTGNWNANASWLATSCAGSPASAFPGIGDTAVLCPNSAITIPGGVAVIVGRTAGRMARPIVSSEVPPLRRAEP